MKIKRGDCYHWAYERLSKEEMKERGKGRRLRGWCLVHGVAFVGGWAWACGGHAWLTLPDGRVWCPTDHHQRREERATRLKNGREHPIGALQFASTRRNKLPRPR